jgi:hypothetical protein
VPAARLVLAALVAVAWWAPPAHAQVMYKWIDADGKVQYSDKRPKDYKGPVTIIQADDAPTAPAPPPKPAPAPAKEAAKPQQDLAAKRRATRDDLWARLIAARDKVEAARKALSSGADPEPEERQVIQQQMKAGEGGMHGLSKARSNCRQVMKDGKNIVICPATLANDAYYERQARLEVAVRQAEEELAAAEEAWRRGVD